MTTKAQHSENSTVTNNLAQSLGREYVAHGAMLKMGRCFYQIIFVSVASQFAIFVMLLTSGEADYLLLGQGCNACSIKTVHYFDDLISN
jgi:hypothetical protein